MEDALVLEANISTENARIVLILVLMEDALVPMSKWQIICPNRQS